MSAAGEGALRVELLYFQGCPSWERAWTELGRALVSERIEATVALRDIEGWSETELRGFAGSPTVRIDGRDLEGYDGPGRMACRRYQENEGRGWPSEELLRARLRAAAGEGPAGS